MSVSVLKADQDRISKWIERFGAVGQFSETGVDRQALTDGDLTVKMMVRDWAQGLGFEVRIDAIGNMFVRRPGSQADAAPVVTGSHLDSEPTGGRYDGAFGVVAGMEVLELLERHAVVTSRPVELAIWTNEEGSRFQPGCMGSAAFVEPARLSGLLDARSLDGQRAGDAVAAHFDALGLPGRPLGVPVHAYVEAHIEQGPVLEQAGNTIGVVTGIQGRLTAEVMVAGRAGHAGTVPHAHRADAFVTATDIAARLRAEMLIDDAARFTIGRFVVSPGSPSVVPEKVVFSIDLRHPDRATLSGFTRKLNEIVGSVSAASLVSVERVDPLEFARPIMALIEQGANQHGYDSQFLPSGASHDAVNLGRYCPAAMIFIPCRDGVSHNELEYAAPADMLAGTNVLAFTIIKLAET